MKKSKLAVLILALLLPACGATLTSDEFERDCLLFPCSSGMECQQITRTLPDGEEKQANVCRPKKKKLKK